MTEIDGKIRQQTAALLAARTKAAAIIVILCILAGIAVDLMAGRFMEHLLREAVFGGGVLLMGAILFVQARARELVSPRHFALTVIFVVYLFMFALSFDVGHYTETVVVVAYVQITMGAAILLPWGAWWQAAVAACAAVLLQWNLTVLPGDVVLFDPSLGVATVNALWLSVFIAYAMEKARTGLLRQRYEQEKQTVVAEEQRAKAEALASDLDAYAHAVAHDLKNPIGVIAGYNDLLSEEKDKLSDDGRWLLESTRRGCEKMAQIVHELLLLASVRKDRNVAIQELDMRAIVSEALDRLSNMIEQAGAAIAVADAWPVASGHAAWVEEVWVNYISNAIKYGGTPPRIEIGADRIDASTVQFWVRDNGDGLTGDQVAGLFREFSRAHASSIDGHGLGLSIVKRIVERLGGEIRVDSTPERGSTFGFTLPCIGSESVGFGSQ